MKALDLDTWQPAHFYIATPGGDPVGCWGYVFRGLALRNSGWASPRSKTKWTLTHIGSGAPIVGFTGTVATVFRVASEVAECSDWTIFDLPDGWKQADPDLKDKVAAICDAHPEVNPEFSVGRRVSDADARAVIEARESVA